MCVLKIVVTSPHILSPIIIQHCVMFAFTYLFSVALICFFICEDDKYHLSGLIYFVTTRFDNDEKRPFCFHQQAQSGAATGFEPEGDGEIF